MKDGKFSSMIKEDNGKISFSRASGLMLLIWSMFICGYLSIQKGEFVDIPPFIFTLIVGLYGINKAMGVINNAINRN